MNGTNVDGRDDVGRCPRCGARVVADQDWCSLCLQPLGRPSEPDPEPDPAPDPTPDPGPDPARDPGLDPDPSTGPAHGELPPLVVESMLAELAASTAAERSFARGPLAGTSRGVRTAIGLGAAVVLVGVLALLLNLVGLVV